jgi:DNA-binding CsgD family transcriptional regulator
MPRPQAIPRPAELTALEAYIAAGSVKAAAHQLGLSDETVRNQLASLRKRLQVGTTAQAIARLYQKPRHGA